MGIRTTVLNVGDDDLPYLPIKTLGKQFRGKGVVTCHAPFECFTHYVGGRTLPCLEPECQACDLERPRRYEGFLSVVWLSGRKHEIVRMTRSAMMQLKGCDIETDDWRGLIVNFERKTERRNGRVCAVAEDTWIEGGRLPECPDLLQHLLRVWRIDGIRVSDDEQAYIHNLHRHLAATLAKGGKSDATTSDGPVEVSAEARQGGT